MGQLDDACTLDSNVHGHVANAASASPEVYEFPEAEGFKYAIRLPANRVLQGCIAHLLKRPSAGHRTTCSATMQASAPGWDLGNDAAGC